MNGLDRDLRRGVGRHRVESHTWGQSMRVLLALLFVLLAGCWPPTKFSGAGGTSVGGARVTDEHDEEQMTGNVPVTQVRMMVVPTALRSAALERRFDLALGWEGEWLHPRDQNALLRSAFVVEATWFASTGAPLPTIRWRVGPTAELVAYLDGFGALVGIAAEYAFDKWEMASRPDAGRRMIGGIVGEGSIGIFLRGGVREHDAGDRDTVILGGVEVELPGFCFVCGLSGGDR